MRLARTHGARHGRQPGPREGDRAALRARGRDASCWPHARAERLAETAAEIEAAGGSRARRSRPTCASRTTSTRSHSASKPKSARIDVLVAGSGIAGPTAELWNVTPEEWEETIRVNLTGTFLTVPRAAARDGRRGAREASS